MPDPVKTLIAHRGILEGIANIIGKVEAMGNPRGMIRIQPAIAESVNQIRHTSILHLPASMLNRPMALPTLEMRFYTQAAVDATLSNFNTSLLKSGKPALSFDDVFGKMESYDPKSEVFVAVVPPEPGLEGNWLSILNKADVLSDIRELAPVE